MRERSSVSSPAKARTFEIEVAYGDEGVWTATSADVPGLNVEGETFADAIAGARIWAPELLRANGVVAGEFQLLQFMICHAPRRRDIQ